MIILLFEKYKFYRMHPSVPLNICRTDILYVMNLKLTLANCTFIVLTDKFFTRYCHKFFSTYSFRYWDQYDWNNYINIQTCFNYAFFLNLFILTQCLNVGL